MKKNIKVKYTDENGKNRTSNFSYQHTAMSLCITLRMMGLPYNVYVDDREIDPVSLGTDHDDYIYLDRVEPEFDDRVIPDFDESDHICLDNDDETMEERAMRQAGNPNWRNG